MPTKETTQALQAMKKQGVPAYKSASGKEPKRKGGGLPGDLVNAVAKLVGWELKTVKTKRGTHPQLNLQGIVHEPKELEGRKATTIHPLRGSSHPQGKSLEERYDAMMSDIQLLGGETEGTSIDDLPDILDALVAAQTFYYFDTFKPEPDKENPNPMTYVMIQGVADDWMAAPPADEPTVEEVPEDEPDQGQDLSPDPDDEIAPGNRVFVQNPEEDEEWYGEVVSRNGELASIKADEDGEEYDEPIDCLTLAEEVDSGEEPEEEPEEGEGGWEEGDYASYTYRNKTYEVTISAYYDDETVDLQVVDSDKTFEGVAVAKLAEPE